MKKSDMQKTNSSVRIHLFHILFVYLQLILTLLTMILLIVSLFHAPMWLYLQLSLGFSFIVMAYNNQVIYKRKGFTILYLVLGVVLVLFALVMLLGV